MYIEVKRYLLKIYSSQKSPRVGYFLFIQTGTIKEQKYVAYLARIVHLRLLFALYINFLPSSEKRIF